MLVFDSVVACCPGACSRLTVVPCAVVSRCLLPCASVCLFRYVRATFLLGYQCMVRAIVVPCAGAIKGYHCKIRHFNILKEITIRENGLKETYVCHFISEP